VKYNYTPLTSALDGVGGQCHAPAALIPRKRSGTHCIGGWVGPRAGLHGSGKSLSLLGFDPRIIQPVASRCSNYAFPARELREDHVERKK
jgi:hypothetical protein